MTTSSTANHPIESSHSHGVAALWASAFVIAALIVLQAGRIGASNEAHAGNVTELGTLRLLTAAAGGDEEIIVLLNSTEESLTIYGIDNGRSVELYQLAKLPELFGQSKALPAGSPTGGRR